MVYQDSGGESAATVLDLVLRVKPRGRWARLDRVVTRPLDRATLRLLFLTPTITPGTLAEVLHTTCHDVASSLDYLRSICRLFKITLQF